MAFSVHGGKHGTISEMNVVPLIDILLVLLVIFMIVTPLTPVGLPAAVPQATDNSKADPPPEVIVVQVLEDGSLRINQTPVRREDLQFRLQEISSCAPLASLSCGATTRSSSKRSPRSSM